MRPLALLIPAILATASPLPAQCLPVEERELVPTPSQPSAKTVAAVSGDVAVFGMPVTETAWILERDAGGAGAWGTVARLTLGANSAFGGAVGASGDYVVIGDVEDSFVDSRNGAVSVHRRLAPGAWAFSEVLRAPDADAGDVFGAAVAIDGDTLVIGAPNDEQHAVDGGSVYVYLRTGTDWAFSKKLLPGVGGGQLFGRALALDGGTLLVGAPWLDLQGFRAGGVHVFERDLGGPGNWGLAGLLEASDAGPGQVFGDRVDLADGAAAILATGHSSPTDSGAVYVFGRTAGGWVERHKITGGELGDLAVAGDTLVVGSPCESSIVGCGGAVRFFRHGADGSPWSLEGTLHDDTIRLQDHFGFGVDLEGDTLVVSSREPRMHVLRMLPAVETYCGPTPAQAVCSPTIDGVGTPSASAPTGFLLRASGMPRGRSALLVYGTHGRGTVPFNAGVLCMTPPIGLAGLARAPGAGGACTGAAELDFNRHVAAGADPALVPGVLIQAQFWYADPAGIRAWSDAIEFPLCP